ncbi:MAG: hypothetical protein FWG02_10895 [Holophagaceae bacterium]|nr:hypothetical protein [Holophagaceae bacterium]
MGTLSRLYRSVASIAATLLVVFLSVGCDKKTEQAKHSLRILILGGTGYLGPATIEAAQARGHKITMFNRGRTRPELFPEVEKLHGDRDPLKGEGLKALEDGEWDVVIDNSGYYPRMVKASAELLSTRSKHYIYISSISAYKEPNPVNGDETAPLATMSDPAVEEMGAQSENFGPLKALCEKAAETAMPGRTTIVRPGYIVGPDDPTGRFTYWPVKFDKSGEVFVPGDPGDPIQFIDVRDLATWLVKLAEDGTKGVFHATGPAGGLKWGQLVDACIQASTANPKPTPFWVNADIVQKHVRPGMYPIWISPSGHYEGFHTWNIQKAVKAGLKFRPVAETVKDTLAWYREQEKVENGRTRLAGPNEERDAKLLEAIKADIEKIDAKDSKGH